jgi:hypothetical protein
VRPHPFAATIAFVLSQASATHLPQAPEKALVLQHCTICHSIDRVLRSGGSVPGWEDRIHRMERWGAKIPAGQIALVAAYLARALPVRLGAPVSESFFANTAVSEVAHQNILTTLRTSATVDAIGKTLVLWLEPADAQWVNLGQHIRAFSAGARTTVVAAKVTGIARRGSRYRVTAAVMTPVQDAAAVHVAEIVVSRGVFLSVPNEAIIEGGERQFVYVQSHDGFARQEVVTGVQGELFTEIVTGARAGEQVVTVGGFFVDAAYRIAGT